MNAAFHPAKCRIARATRALPLPCTQRMPTAAPGCPGAESLGAAYHWRLASDSCRAFRHPCRRLFAVFRRHYANVRICIYNSRMKPENIRRDDTRAPMSPLHPLHNGEAGALVLAADVGGTHARIGLLRARAGAHPPLDMLARHVYECAKWPGLGEILEDFLVHHANGRGGIARCALAVAGYLRGDELVSENLRWPVRISELRERLQLDRLDIVNDFEALACGTRFLSRSESIAVINANGTTGPTVVVGPGTGLGCAVLLPNGDAPIVMPSEAGHVALAPGNEREIEVLRRLCRDH